MPRSNIATSFAKGVANRLGARQKGGRAANQQLMPMAGRWPSDKPEPEPDKPPDEHIVDIVDDLADHQLEARYETTGQPSPQKSKPADPPAADQHTQPIQDQTTTVAEAPSSDHTSVRSWAMPLIALAVFVVCIWTYRSEANAPVSHTPIQDTGASAVAGTQTQSTGVVWLDGPESSHTPYDHSYQHSSSPRSNQHSEVFPVALLEKFCEPFDAKTLETGFANPHSLILLSFLAPVLFALIKLLQRFAKLHAATVTAMASSVSKSMSSLVNSGTDSVLRKSSDLVPSSVREDAHSAVQTKADRTKQAADQKIEQTANAQKDMVAGKVETMDDHLDEAFGSDIDTSSARKSDSSEEYKLRVAKEDTAREVEMAQTVSFTLIHLGLAIAVAVDYFEQINSSVTGDSIMCVASKVLVIPLFKAFAVSMWNVLMSVTNYVHWEYSRTVTPKDVVTKALIAAPLRPVHRNIIIRAVTLASAGALSAWTLAALIVAPALIGFFPIALLLLVVVPVAILVLPLCLISWVWSCVPDDAAELKTRRLLALKKYFDKIDKDKSGKLSKKELRAYFRVSASFLPIERMWHKLDSNDDDEVTIAEFMAAAGLREEWEAHEEKVASGGDEKNSSHKSVLSLLTAEPRLLLKVGLMQAFTTMMLMAWFGGVYYGQESWSSAARWRCCCGACLLLVV